MESLNHQRAEEESSIESLRLRDKRAYVHEVGKGDDGKIIKIERDELGSVSSTTPYNAVAYSRMKHGDPEAIRGAAQEIFVRIIRDDSIMSVLLANRVVITNSARKVPTASFTIMKVLTEDLLNPYLRGVGATPIDWVITEGGSDSYTEDYAADVSNGEDQEERQPFFSEFSQAKLRDKKVILFNDLVATGSYERNQTRLLNDVGIGDEDIIPLYWIEMEKEASENPEFESEINYAGMKELDDLLDFFYDPRLTINARTVKYIFSLKNPETDEIDPKKAEELQGFFRSLGEVPSDEGKQEDGRRTLLKLYEAMKSEDGYSSMEAYSDGYRILDEYLIELKIHPRKSFFSTKTIDSKAEVTGEEARMYSLMKYGDPEAIQFWAEKMTDRIISDPEMSTLFRENKFLITSSAFGSVQTAANTVASEVTRMLQEKGFEVGNIKIDRAGGFAATNYGQMGEEQRKRYAYGRRISISDDTKEEVKDAVVLVIDDVKVTGTHEKMINTVLEPSDAKEYLFGYAMDFGPNISKNEPEAEEWLNRNAVSDINDLLPAFAGDEASPALNARTLKFILETDAEENISHEEKLRNLENFFMSASDTVLCDIYNQATSADSYQIMPKFRPGFQVLRRVVVKRKLVDVETLNRDEDSLALYNATVDQGSNFSDMESGENLNHVAEQYSRMKCGGIEETKFFGKRLAQKIINRIETDPSFAQTFESARENGEFIYAFAPGSRNVDSASNYFAEDVVERVNAYLSLKGLPTIIIKKLTRLGSTNVNYAALGADERAKVKTGTTRSIMPVAEIQEHPIHVIFIDDVEITGATLERTRKECTEAGALSFNSIFGMKIDPVVAHESPEVENVCNTVVIKGDLNDEIARIINHEDYRPVQRSVRILLHPNNTEEIEGFLEGITEKSLIKLYRSALSNDYLWVRDEFYKPSLEIFIDVMRNRDLINEDGMLAY